MLNTFFLIFLSICFVNNANARLVEYKIDITYKTMNVTGEQVEVIALGKEGEAPSVPAPTLEFEEGDTLRVTFNNKLKEESSIHWHGLLLPNDQDGVPHVTTKPIMAGHSHTFEFPLKQSGTYWYHSHTDLQEQRGVYGAIVIHPKQKLSEYEREMVVVLSDWTNRNPKQIMINLKTDGEWEQIQKNTLRSWFQDVKEGTIKKRVKSELERMGPMDVADVAYDAFLVNGKRGVELKEPRPGERVLLRVINASASSYFYIGYGEQKMTVVSADGLDVKPVEVDEIKIGTAETYDVIVTVLNGIQTEFRATAQDLSGSISLFVGEGEKESARTPHKANPYGHGGHDHKDNLVRLDYDMLQSLTDTSLPLDRETMEFEIRLEGDMRRSVWTFNGKILADSDYFVIQKGKNVRFTLVNSTMMNHPLHLHGHFFRVPNDHEEFSPLKHTIDVGPMENRVIEFAANEEKDWLFHCHNLYHMGSGMTQVVRYKKEDGGPQQRIGNMGGMSGTQWHTGAQLNLGSNFSSVKTQSSTSKYDLFTKTECEYQNSRECEARAEGQKIFSRYFAGYGALNIDEKGPSVSAGVGHFLPMMIDAHLGAGSRGIEYSIGKSFPLTRRISLRTEIGRQAGKKRYDVGVEFRKSKRIGIGVGVSEKGVGVGVQIRK